MKKRHAAPLGPEVPSEMILAEAEFHSQHFTEAPDPGLLVEMVDAMARSGPLPSNDFKSLDAEIYARWLRSVVIEMQQGLEAHISDPEELSRLANRLHNLVFICIEFGATVRDDEPLKTRLRADITKPATKAVIKTAETRLETIARAILDVWKEREFKISVSDQCAVTIRPFVLDKLGISRSEKEKLGINKLKKALGRVQDWKKRQDETGGVDPISG